jgi:hypothetical protein
MCSASSSVFVVADEANSNLWKALITGEGVREAI